MSALPSASQTVNKDIHLAARLKEFASQRNLSDLPREKTKDEKVVEKSETVPQEENKEPNNKGEAPETERKATETNEKKDTTTKDVDSTTEKGPTKEKIKKEPSPSETEKTDLEDASQSRANVGLQVDQSHVKLLKKNECAQPASVGDQLQVTFMARVNSNVGPVYYQSNGEETMVLGQNDLVFGLDDALLDACKGDRMEVTIPFEVAHDANRETRKKFHLKSVPNLVVWIIEVMEATDIPDDDDLLESDMDQDADADQEKDNTKTERAKKQLNVDQWKQVLGLELEHEVEIQEEQTVFTNIAEVVNGTNVTRVNSTIETVTKKVMQPSPLVPSKEPTMLPLHPEKPYLGVLVDGGRHYFPLDWLKTTVDRLHMLRYNFIHLRLTDDQAFNVRLKSHPELAVPAPATAEDSQKSNPVWTPEELKELVKYAKEKGITIMPEINAPGHCASWGGIPGLIVPCPQFACEKGYGVPLNESSPLLMGVIKDVIEEVMEIFDSPPYLHLGGDEVHMSKACYQEIEQVMPKYNNFEQGLKRVLAGLKISEDTVVRWETTGQKGIDIRAGKIIQWWEAFPKDKRKDGEFFTSQGLYFDSCGDREGQEFFEHTQKLVREDPKAIIAGTFELSTHWWEDRNVFGRLLAVAMGASKEGQRMKWSSEIYRYFCQSQGWPYKVCKLDARPVLSTSSYLGKWKKHWTTWKAATCDRLTESYEVRVMRDIASGVSGEKISTPDLEVEISVDRFWHNFGKTPHGPQNVNATALGELERFHSSVPHLGATMEVSFATLNYSKTAEVFDMLAKLGFNLVHLRLQDDSSFPVSLHSHPSIAWDGSLVEKTDRRRPWEKLQTLVKDNVTTKADIIKLVKLAATKGIKVMPEISVVSNAGGWFASGMVARCPNVICDTDYGLPLNITKSQKILSVLSNVIFELKSLFTSEYIHLGYENRNESQACYDELEVSADFDLFEKKLSKVLELQGISPQHVLRWESTDGEMEKKHRAGNITHFHTVVRPSASQSSFFSSWLQSSENSEPFFISTGLNSYHKVMDDKNQTVQPDAWTIYQQTRKLVKTNPTGIIAQYLLTSNIKDGSSSTWSITEMGRMIAVAMGASNKPKLKKDKFREEYMKACNATQLDQTTCELFGKDDTTASVEEKRALETKKTCEAFTKVETRRRMKKGVIAKG